MSKYDDATAHPLQRRDPEGARGLDAASVWTLHLACGHVRTFHDPDGKGAPLGTATCSICRHREPITRRFKDGHETC